MFLNISSHGKSRQVITATENNSSSGKSELPSAKYSEDDAISIFHLAASVGDMSKLRACGYVDIPDAIGCTPLHYAVSAHQIEAAKYLVSCGADCHKMADNGTTPLSMAKMLGDSDLLEALTANSKKDPLDVVLQDLIEAISCNHPPNRIAGFLKKLAVIMLERDTERTPPSPLASECLSKLNNWGML